MEYLIYNTTDKKIYYKNLELVEESSEVYSVIQKYKILPNLTNVKIYAKTIKSADNGLVYTGQYINGLRLYFCYGTEHIKNRRKSKNTIFLKIHKIKDNIIKDITNFGRFNTDNYLIKVLTLLLFETGMRLGKREFKIKYNTIGAITLEKQHLLFNKKKIIINFIGKKKVNNEYIVVKNTLIKELKKLCKPISPETELFKNITEYKINNYLKQYSITAKDIRTYYLNNELINSVLKFTDKKPKELLKYIASLGNHTTSVSKTSYLSDKILELLLQNNCTKLTKQKIIDYLESE